MSSQDRAIQTLTKRLERIERQNRRLKRGGLAFIAIFGLLILSGQAPKQDSVTAEKFVVHDDKGKTRAHFGSLGDGEFGLYLFDESERIRLQLSLAEGEVPSLFFFDKNGRIRVMLVSGLGKGETASTMAFYDDKGTLLHEVP